MKRRLVLITLCLGILVSSAVAQKEVRQHLNKGNNSFKKGNYTAAEINYRKALELNPTDKEGQYNLANTLLQTKRGEEAGRLYSELLKEQARMDLNKVADVAHNAGNLMMNTKQYEQAIAYYKESLRKRPSDDETRYNLALAQKLLEQQKQEGGGNDNQNQDQQQEQDQDKEQEQDKEQNKDQQQEQDQNKNGQEQEDKGEPKRQQPSEMSKENTEQILNAFLQKEKKTQEKIERVKVEQQKGKSPRRENW